MGVSSQSVFLLSRNLDGKLVPVDKNKYIATKRLTFEEVGPGFKSYQAFPNHQGNSDEDFTHVTTVCH